MERQTSTPENHNLAEQKLLEEPVVWQKNIKKIDEMLEA